MFKSLTARRLATFTAALIAVFALAFNFVIAPAFAEEAPASGDESSLAVGAGNAETTGAETTGAETTGAESTGETEKTEEAKEDTTKKHSLTLAIIGGAISAAFVALIVFANFGKKGVSSKRITSIQLTESALMVAVATVCSLIKIDLPYGGGVTIVSMLPLVIISHRYGWRWGLMTAFVYSLIQLVLGLDNVGYATSTAMMFGVIFLDYIVAYTVIGLAGAFGKGRKGVAVGIIVTFFLRFACHYVTGVWIWKEWMPETFLGLKMTSPWIYSALYNGWYMLAELIITLVVTMLIYQPLSAYFENKEA